MFILEKLNRTKSTDKEFLGRLSYENIAYTGSDRDFIKIEDQSSICMNMFKCKGNVEYHLYVWNKKILWLFEPFISGKRLY